MATVEKFLLAAAQTLVSVAANMASNALALGAAIDNTAGAGGTDGYTLCDIEFTGTFNTAPAASTGLSVWLLRAPGGTTYEDGDGSVSGGSDLTPARAPDLVIPVRAVTTAQRVTVAALLPSGKFKGLAKNDGTGAQLNSGWSISIRPVTREGI